MWCELYLWDKLVEECVAKFVGHREPDPDIGGVPLQTHNEALPKFIADRLKRPLTGQVLLKLDLQNVPVTQRGLQGIASSLLYCPRCS